MKALSDIYHKLDSEMKSEGCHDLAGMGTTTCKPLSSSLLISSSISISWSWSPTKHTWKFKPQQHMVSCLFRVASLSRCRLSGEPHCMVDFVTHGPLGLASWCSHVLRVPCLTNHNDQVTRIPSAPLNQSHWTYYMKTLHGKGRCANRLDNVSSWPFFWQWVGWAHQRLTTARHLTNDKKQHNTIVIIINMLIKQVSQLETRCVSRTLYEWMYTCGHAFQSLHDNHPLVYATRTPCKSDNQSKYSRTYSIKAVGGRPRGMRPPILQEMVF
jgi:hypothetical protein